MPADEWTPPADLDAKVREWMKDHGWPVNSTRYYEEGVYAWRHDLAGGGSPTLWITREAIEDQDSTTLMEELDRLGVADRIRDNAKKRFLVSQEGGHLRVAPWGHSATTDDPQGASIA
jgi:hypothetical protein